MRVSPCLASSQCREATLDTVPYRGVVFVFLVYDFSASEARVEAERRQVTVLFTDMVGFTSFSERSGEEAAYTLMRSLSKLMDEAVREQGGVVRGFTGDGIMAVFGAPVALEDAPLRACRAALGILRRLKSSRT